MGGFPTLFRTIILLLIVLALLFTMLGISLFHKDFESTEVAQNTHSSNTYLKKSRISDFLSTFGSKEYKCYGTCSCFDEGYDPSRRVANVASQTLRIAVTGIFSVSAYLAIRSAQNKFEDDCVDVLEGQCERTYVQADVSECEETQTNEDGQELSSSNDNKGDACQLSDAISQRQSIRDYSDESVPKHTIEDIVTAGNRAPSAMNQQPLRYYVCDDKQVLQEISDVCLGNRGNKPLPRPMTSIFYNAPVVIFITWMNGGDGYEQLDAGLAMQNMQLKGYGEGLGSCCIGNVMYGETHIAQVLGFQPGEKLMCALLFGYPNPDVDVPMKERNPNKIDWSKFGESTE